MQRRSVPLIAAILLGLFIIGCAHAPINAPLSRYQPNAGYRFANLTPGDNTDSLFVVLTFSGGGTRAASLSYGVLKALSETTITWQGKTKRLLDEVDLISTISGGSFTGAYYALFGDWTFDEFESRFLKRDIEGELTGELWNPVTLIRLASPSFDRIDLAAELYDRTIFEDKTYEALVSRPRRPFLVISATNMSLGERFDFTQDRFDQLGSDLSSYPVARAVAASSAFPILLSPITLENHPSPPGYEQPDWVKNALGDYNLNRRRYLQDKEWMVYHDKTDHPYVHLLDGGLADNIGLRYVTDSIRDADRPGGIRQLINQVKIDTLVVIIVNARTEPSEPIDKKARAPGVARVAMKTATVTMDNYSFETIELIKDIAVAREQAQRSVRDCRQLLAERCPAAAPPPELKEMKFYVIEVNFENIADPKEREEFLSLPTSFKLDPAVVDRLIQKGGDLLRQSPEFKDLLKELH
ncbi:MAG: patatin-like phospholipase family protein [Nitrospirae bacterium]|nr:patatin-like phospholipase family protein [Nitrospirota bacterium]